MVPISGSIHINRFVYHWKLIARRVPCTNSIQTQEDQVIIKSDRFPRHKDWPDELCWTLSGCVWQFCTKLSKKGIVSVSNSHRNHFLSQTQLNDKTSTLLPLLYFCLINEHNMRVSLRSSTSSEFVRQNLHQSGQVASLRICSCWFNPHHIPFAAKDRHKDFPESFEENNVDQWIYRMVNDDQNSCKRKGKRCILKV